MVLLVEEIIHGNSIVFICFFKFGEKKKLEHFSSYFKNLKWVSFWPKQIDGALYICSRYGMLLVTVADIKYIVSLLRIACFSFAYELIPERFLLGIFLFFLYFIHSFFLSFLLRQKGFKLQMC